MAEQDIPPPTITAMKIPIIRKGEYDIWSMRMRQYICHTDHNLWDVIVNGDLEEEPAPTGDQSGPSAPPAPKTAKQLAARRNQERVKSILLLAIPDEYLLKFHNVADAKSLWEAIKSRFGGNVESKKMQKNVLKHQFENFSTASNESLDKAYDRFQKLISQLEVHGAPISKEDINQKFLRSLPSSWNQIALIMRNKPDIDEIDIDDLYNNLRVYEDELKRTTSPKLENGDFSADVMENDLGGIDLSMGSQDGFGGLREITLNHVSKDSGSIHAPKVEYVEPNRVFQVLVDSGCSSHMTGNKAYLSDYEDFNGGFMAFGSDPKGVKVVLKELLEMMMCTAMDLKNIDPSENGVVERKNRTLIEAARTMLADSLLPIPFWAEAVNTGWCPLTILNTLDSLGKFDGKSDEGYLLGYSTSSKAFRMFDLDFLTNSMNYVPVSLENQVNVDVDKDVQDLEDAADKEEQHQMQENEKDFQDELEMMVTQELAAKAMNDVSRQAFEKEKRRIASHKNAAQATSLTPNVSAASTSTGANADESLSVYLGGKIPIDASTLPNADLPIDLNMPALEDASDTLPIYGIFNRAYDDDKDVGVVADFNNMDNTITVNPIPTLRIHKDHPKGKILGDPILAVQTRGKIQKASSAQQALVEAMQEELLQFKLQSSKLQKGLCIVVFAHPGKRVLIDGNAQQDIGEMSFLGMKSNIFLGTSSEATNLLESLLVRIKYVTVITVVGQVFGDRIQMRINGDLVMSEADRGLSRFYTDFNVADLLAKGFDGKNFSGKVTPLFDLMLVQQTEDEGEASERSSDSQPIPSPPHSSEDQPQTQTAPSLRPSPSIVVPDPEGSGGNHGGQSSNDASLSGNEDGLTLQTVYDLCVSLCKQVTAQAKEIQALKAQVKKLKKGVKPLITHHKAWMKTRLARKTSLKKNEVHQEYVSKQGRKSIKSFKGEPSAHKDPAFDDLDDIMDDTLDYIETEDAQDEEMISYVVLEEKENADKEVSTEAPVSTVKPNEGTDKKNEGTEKQDGVVAPVTAGKPHGTTHVVTRGYLMINCKDDRSLRGSGSEGLVRGSGSEGSTRFRVYKVASQSQAAT
ncbi:ribonuclease H-like domain-containing protein [Tanacetum coccineum]